jgi:hypothetical protein
MLAAFFPSQEPARGGEAAKLCYFLLRSNSLGAHAVKGCCNTHTSPFILFDHSRFKAFYQLYYILGPCSASTHVPAVASVVDPAYGLSGCYFFNYWMGASFLYVVVFVRARKMWVADMAFADTVVNTPGRLRHNVAVCFWSGRTFWEEPVCSG